MAHVQGAKAAAFIWGGMLIIGAADNLMPLLTPVSSLWTFHLLRSAMVLLILVTAAPVAGWRLWPNRPRAVLARNLFSGAAMFLYFGSLAFVPIGVAVAGLFTAPVFVLLFSALFRAERVGLVRWLAVAIGFAGALLVIQPEEGGITLASLLPVLGGVFYAIGALATRSWCEGEGTVPMLVSYYVVIALGGAVGLAGLAVWPIDPAAGSAGFIARGWVAPDGWIWLWLLLQAVTSVIGVGCLTRGYQIGEATYVAINEYALILFASVFAWVFWDQFPGSLARLGMVMIIAAGAVITLRSERPDTPDAGAQAA